MYVGNSVMQRMGYYALHLRKGAKESMHLGCLKRARRHFFLFPAAICIGEGKKEGYPGMLSQSPRSGCIFVFLTFCCCIRDLKIHVLHFPKGVVQ